MKIALVCYKFPPLYSGYGKQLKTISENILKNNNDIEFNVLTAAPDTSSTITRMNLINLLRENKKEQNQARNFYVYVIKVFLWLIFNRNRYDVIHCVKAGPEAMVSTIVGKLYKKKVIIKIAQDELGTKEIERSNIIRRIPRILRRTIIKHADNFIAISTEIESRLKGVGIKESQIKKIPNGVDERIFFPVTVDQKKKLRKEYDIDEANIVVMFAGSICVRKGIFDLLNSIELIKNDLNKVTFLLCGPMYEKEKEFYKQLDELNGNNNINIIYKGEVSNTSVFMQLADIMILPSYSEGLPNVLLEAGMSGLPLLASNIGGNVDIVQNGENGLLYEVGNVHELTLSLIELINNENYRKNLGKSSLMMAKNKYSVQKISNGYLKLYKN
ncbi:hypothetical protein AB685_25050 [Bacillus sp. LL01]|uniref:glycosyltransferase family 4 protein n=1 Tax=Bacillus sp. LL01 TaxID=1665556 RepID=UPI00064D3899|nr:glycosyltransferase family 4 protein [Bacillus sp. LL01]KMJ55853.1 hypothetical protein AB685_25050 [Bacillus sp. LL01]